MRKSRYYQCKVSATSEKVPASVNYPFSPQTYSNSPVAQKIKRMYSYFWVVHKLGISGGCGNSDQYQIKTDMRSDGGVFELKKGQWRKIS